MYKNIISLFFVALTFVSPASQAVNSVDIITYGDSLTAGLSRTAAEVVTCPVGVNMELGRFGDDNRQVCYGDGVINRGGYQPGLASLLLNDGVAPIIANYGFSGIRSDQMIPLLNGVVASRPHAQYVIIMAGANDAIMSVSVSTLLSNLSVMISQVQSYGLIPVIATVTPNARASAFERKTKQYSAAIRSYAASNNILLADSRAALEGGWESNNSGDGLHLSAAGNGILAGLFHSTLNLQTSRKVTLSPIINLLLSDN